MTIHATSGIGARGSGLVDSTGSLLRTSRTPNPDSRLPVAGGRDTPELHKAFTDFVGQTFFGELVKQMRATVDKPAFFHGGMGEDIFQTQLDQIMVERMSDVNAPTSRDTMSHLMIQSRS